MPDGKVIAEELIRAFAGQYQCKEPRDARTLERLGRTASGDPLVDLIQAKEVAPEDGLRLGLIALVALAGPGANRRRLAYRAIGAVQGGLPLRLRS